MKIVTWNINSVRVRLKQLEKLVFLENPDIICLQEIKVANNDFPYNFFKDQGYKYIEVHGEKAYNGVAILSKIMPYSTFTLSFANEKDRRHVAMKLYNGLEIHNFYIPAGGEIPDENFNPKFKHKLQYFDELTTWFSGSRTENDKLVLLGDLNVAPLEHDVWSHKQLLTEVSHTPIEIEKMRILKDSLNWHDAIRSFTDETQKLYSWWSYRNRDWNLSDRGRRLDHIWVTPDIKENVKKGYIMREMRGIESPSDHVPVIMVLDMEV